MATNEDPSVSEYAESDLLMDLQTAWGTLYPDRSVPDSIDVDVKGLGSICRRIAVKYASKPENIYRYSKGQVAGGVAWFLYEGNLTLRDLSEMPFEELERVIPFEDYVSNPKSYPPKDDIGER